jgi:hypothetical protein
MGGLACWWLLAGRPNGGPDGSTARRVVTNDQVPSRPGDATAAEVAQVHAAVRRLSPGAVAGAVDRPRKRWIQIPVPAIISRATFERAAQRLQDNKRFASRNSKVPSLLQGLAACERCDYGSYRTSTRTTNKKIYYYRCLGSDDYRYEGGRVCSNRPVRADYLDTIVWDHITGLLADPSLVRAEIDSGWNGPARPIRPPASTPACSSPWPRPPPRSPA